MNLAQSAKNLNACHRQQPANWLIVYHFSLLTSQAIRRQYFINLQTEVQKCVCKVGLTIIMHLYKSMATRNICIASSFLAQCFTLNGRATTLNLLYNVPSEVESPHRRAILDRSHHHSDALEELPREWVGPAI